MTHRRTNGRLVGRDNLSHTEYMSVAMLLYSDADDNNGVLILSQQQQAQLATTSCCASSLVVRASPRAYPYLASIPKNCFFEIGRAHV